MDNRDFELLDKAVSGLIAGQQEMSHEHGQTKMTMRAMQETMVTMQAAMVTFQEALGETMETTERLEQASKRQEDRYRDLLDVLRTIGHSSTETQQRLTNVETRLGQIEDAG